MDIIQIVKRVAELAEKYNCKMSQIAIAWQWAKGILSPIIGATKTQYLDDSAGAFDIKLTAEDLAYLEEPYVPHEIVGAIDKNPAQDVKDLTNSLREKEMWIIWIFWAIQQNLQSRQRNKHFIIWITL